MLRRRPGRRPPGQLVSAAIGVGPIEEAFGNMQRTGVLASVVTVR